MKLFRHKSLRWIAGLSILGIIVVFFQLGPPSVGPGEDRILSTLQLNKESTLYLVAKRGWVDYDIDLYRVDGTNVWIGDVDFETAYWWGGNLKLSSSGQVDIRSFGSSEGSYSITNGTISLERFEGTHFPLHLIDGVNLNRPIPKQVLSGK
jgi:hypothetical protein